MTLLNSKRYTLPVIVLAILAVAAYLLLRGRNSSAAWRFIPTSANAVLTSDRLQDSTFLVTEASINVKQFPLISQATESLSLLLWITRDIPVFESTLKGKLVTYSYHPRTSAGFGVIMYVPLDGQEEIDWWTKPNRPDTRVMRHTFQNTAITDINNTASKPVCSYIIRDKYLIVSQYGDLIEDVLRQSSSGGGSFPLQAKFERADDSGYGLNVYLDQSVWKNLIFKPLASQSTLVEYFKLFPAFQDYHLQDPEQSTVEFVSLGADRASGYAADWLDGLPGKPFDRHRHISQQTSLFFRIASGDSLAFGENFRDWHDGNGGAAWDKLGYYVGEARQDLITNVGSELILCQMEGNNSIIDGKLALIEYAHYDKLRPMLTKLAKLANEESNASLGKQQGYDLFSVPIPELPAALYGPLFAGFPRTYLSYVGPYLVLSNSSQVLQNYISDYENRLSWEQSPELDSVLISDRKPAQLALVASLRKVSSATHGTGMFSTNVESVVFECLLDGRKSYPRLSILSKKRRTSGKVLNRTFLSSELEWTEGNTELVAISQNQLDGSARILVTDQQNQLLRFGAGSEEPSPFTQLDGPLVVQPFKADFLNIGRQQLILATARSLYAIDEDDKGIVTPIRVGLPSNRNIKQLVRIDGGSAGSSRFVATDEADDLYLWDNAGATPRKINRGKTFNEIISPVLSLDQLGTRSLIVTQSNGLVYLLREDGTIRSGFPIDMLARISGAFAWSQNPLTAQPELVGSSATGELLRIATNGSVQERRQLLRPQSSERFRTIFDQNSLDWLLLRTTATRAALLNKAGNEIFEIQDIAPGSVIQYHYFGVDNRFISVSSGGYTSIFDMTGRRLGDKPIPSEVPIRLSYQAAYYKVFIFGRNEGKYQAWTIKIR